MKPLLPSADRLAPYLERIDANRWYSNMGPLLSLFEERLAEHFGVSTAEVVTSANGTLGMVQALWAVGARPGSLCVTPSWTFVATPAAAKAAGLEPYFIDVDPESWAIQPEAVEALLAQGLDVGAVIPVSPFGAPLELTRWEAFADQTGVSVVIDAAAGFDSLAGTKTRLPCVVSLHATKVFGVGEGAVVLCGDGQFAQEVRKAGNFGFQGSRDAQMPGVNAKLSEYAAAVGLAGFDMWPETRARWRSLGERFAKGLATLPKVRPGPGAGGAWASCYGLVELTGADDAEGVAAALAQEGVETRAWWGRGCHTQPAYRSFPRAALPHTERLAERVLGLPFWLGVEELGLDMVFERLRVILEAGA